MKFAIGFMCHNELPWLKLHLPVWMSAASVDGLIAVDGGSTDGTIDYLVSQGIKVVNRTWDWKPLDQENAVIDAIEADGYDAMLFTAPDELWFPEHIDNMKAILGTGHVSMLQFPTFNFVRDRLHFAPMPPFYPDLHQRAWMMEKGYRHVGQLDSIPNAPVHEITRLSFIHMFHYSHIKSREYYTLKHINFYRVRDGLEPLDKKPLNEPLMDYPVSVPFTGGRQPLDPYEIGIYAPLESSNAEA